MCFYFLIISFTVTNDKKRTILAAFVDERAIKLGQVTQRYYIIQV